MANATATPKEPKLATKSTEMTLDEKRALLLQLQEEIEKETVKEFEKDINYIVARAKNQNRKLFDYMEGLFKVMAFEERQTLKENFLKLWGIEQASGAATPRKPRSANGSASRKEVAFVRGTTYVDPAGVGKPWTAGGQGAKPKWLADAIKDLDFEAAKAKYAELAQK